MALFGYKAKQKKAPWFIATPPPQPERKIFTSMHGVVYAYGIVYAPKKRIRSRTPARAKQEREYRQKAWACLTAAIARGETCPVVAVIPEIADFPNMVTQIHHKRGRRRSLLLDQRHWLPVSAAGHAWIEAHPNEARTRGWLCEKGLFNTPDRS